MLILTLKMFITNRQSGHTRKTCLYQKKLLIGTEHQNNIEEQCSPGWTSETRLAFVPFGPLQLRSNVFVGFLVSFHRLIGLVFERINRRDLLPICYLHVFHVFDVADDIWVLKRYLWWTAALVLNSIELLSLLRPLHLSLRFFLFFLFLRLLELLVRPKQADLLPFALLRNGLWTLLQQVNCFSLMVCTEKLRVSNELLVA